MSLTLTGGGRFDPSEKNVYFLAGSLGNLTDAVLVHRHLLIAVNELRGPEAANRVDALLTDYPDVSLFLDSGIFNLTNEHCRKTGVTMDTALALAPEEITGFDKLWNDYLRLIGELGERSWGYIELDQGGRENKIRTRARIEALGHRPIPVYHPLNDGWDYFDYLAERYDRICFGNVVQADVTTRKKLIATAWERHRKYPHLWIHLLGYTPNHWMNALPINSGDSSSWLACSRWNGMNENIDGADFSIMPKNFQYCLENERAGARKAQTISAFSCHIRERNLRQHRSDLESLGCSIYPPQPETVVSP